jgi:ribosome maturation protein Sdo1
MSSPIKFFYKGQSKDFIIFTESDKITLDYLHDSSIPLTSVVAGGFKVYTPVNGRGSEGILEEASDQDLANEFGTTKVEDIIAKILKHGESKSGADVHRKQWTSTNDANGLSIDH